jgi:phosphonate transport system permease protein
VVAVLLLWPLLTLTQFEPRALLEANNLHVMHQFLAGFWPPVVSADFLYLLLQATWQTLAMATAGTALAVVLAVPLALLATSVLSVSSLGRHSGGWAGRVLRRSVRVVLLLLRGVPELVWALLWVRALGLGPAAGVLAIAITYSGMLGKVYSEILESGPTRPARVLLEAGAGRLGALLYGLVPGVAQELVSYTVYRWECAVRASVVMGFVGAGGLGQLMEQSIKMLNGGEACTVLLVFLGLVLLADTLSAGLRRITAACSPWRRCALWPALWWSFFRPTCQPLL